MESYVYAVLGAQARLKWPIVGRGAKSLQTQHTFGKIVNDNIAQDNEDVLVSDMRKAIKSTNVVLNLSILPGVILVPSNMVILDKPIAGYNNVLTTATKEMKFGVDQRLNYSPTNKSKPTTPTTLSIKEKKVTEKSFPNKVVLNQEHKSNLNYLFGILLIGGAILTKLLL